MITETSVTGRRRVGLTSGPYPKRKILGENPLRLSGMDVEETRQKLAKAS